MKSVLQRLAVGVLAAWLVLLSAIAYPQLTAHAAQHAHHDATTHVTVLCSWLCMDADAVEGTSVHLAPVEQFDFIEEELLGPQVSAALSFQPPSRAPPLFLRSCALAGNTSLPAGASRRENPCREPSIGCGLRERAPGQVKDVCRHQGQDTGREEGEQPGQDGDEKGGRRPA